VEIIVPHPLKHGIAALQINSVNRQVNSTSLSGEQLSLSLYENPGQVAQAAYCTLRANSEWCTVQFNTLAFESATIDSKGDRAAPFTGTRGPSTRKIDANDGYDTNHHFSRHLFESLRVHLFLPRHTAVYDQDKLAAFAVHDCFGLYGVATHSQPRLNNCYFVPVVEKLIFRLRKLTDSNNDFLIVFCCGLAFRLQVRRRLI
jgi:hypothetical protein